MAANLDGAMTPRPQSRTAHAPPAETAAIRELLATMKGTLITLYVEILHEESLVCCGIPHAIIVTTPNYTAR